MEIRASISGLSRLAAYLWLPLGLGACDIFDVDNPGAVTEEDLDDPALLNTFLSVPEAAGAEYHDFWVMHTGLIGNDFMEPATRNDAVWTDEGEFHLQPNPVLEGLYDNLAQAVWVIRDARARIEALVDNPGSHPAIARAYFWDGHTQASRADMFDNITYDRGPPSSPLETYDEALGLLERAVDVATAAGEELYVAAAYATMARIERSLFFERDDPTHLTRAAQYAEEALAVRPDFRLEARFGPPGKTNTLYGQIGATSSSAYGVGQIFAEEWTDPVTGESDSRISSFITSKIADLQRGPSYKQVKYPEAGSSIAISRWQEPVLIIAEYRLESGDLDDAVAQINTVRQAANRPQFQSDDEDEIRAQLLYERQTEFFLEGRNWQDLRYYGIFPDRWNPRARQLGLDRRVPWSTREQIGS